MEGSKRIKSLKKQLIKELPFYPNDNATKVELEGQGLNGVLVHYLHWKTRIVPPRPRKVHIHPEVTSDKRWKNLKEDVYELFKKVSLGENLLPYLSKRAHSYGYTPKQRIIDKEVNSWDDKDQLLNTAGFHHFHLNMNIQNTGLSERSDEVIFAQVSRSDFHAVGIFNHSVFDHVDDSGNITAERSRMWELYKKNLNIGMEPGAVYISHPIMMSGHPLYIVETGDFYARIIREYDKNLDDRLFVNDLYVRGKLQTPKSYNFEWQINALDLCIFDKKTSTLFSLHQGHI